MSKKNKIVTGIILLGCCFIVLVAFNPFKVTDPSDPKFNPDKFSFKDYKGEEVYGSFRKLFPVGTSKEFVERILVKAGKANFFQSDAYPEVFLYSAPPRFFINDGGTDTYTVIYDKNNKFLNIQGAPSHKPLYPDQISWDDLMKEYLESRKSNSQPTPKPHPSTPHHPRR